MNFASSSSWRPLNLIIYGFAIHPLSSSTYNRPTTATLHPEGTTWSEGVEGHPALTVLAELDVGDEVYAFEHLVMTDPSNKRVVWYRGYVVSSSRKAMNASQTDTSATGSTSVAAEEPQVSIAIFPEAFIHIRDELPDSEGKLAEMYRTTLAGQDSSNSTSPLSPLTKKDMFPMETLREEDEAMDPEIREGTSHQRRPTSPRGPRPIVNGSPIAVALDNARAARPPSISPVEKPSPPHPSLKSGDDTAAGQVQPLVDEIASALREWHSLLFVYLSKRDYKMFALVKDHLETLHLWRRQLLSETLSAEETAQLRKECVARLVRGNVVQNLDVIVRHPSWGGLVTVDVDGDVDGMSWVSGVRMYAMQSSLAYIEESPAEAGHISRTSALFNSSDSYTSPNSDLKVLSPSVTRPTPSLHSSSSKAAIKFYHVYLDLRAFVASPCAPGETAELFFSLYNKSAGRFLTEEFCAILNHNGVPARDTMGKVRTLFRDLGQQDVHDSIYLVCRIVRNGAMRMSSNPSSSSYVRSTSVDSRMNSAGEGSGDRSFTMDHSDQGSGGDGSPTFRRPFGCAVLELSQLTKMAAGMESSAAKEHVLPIFVPVNEASYSTLHQHLISSNIKDFEKSPRAEMLAVTIKFFHGEASTVIKENPSLLQDAPITSRLGFPDVVFPDDVRNEVYIKLWSGSFNPSSGGTIRKLAGSGTGLSNVEVTVEVRTRTGQTIEDAIYLGTGEPPISQYRSLTFYHNNTPTYGELLKLRVPPETMEQCHLFFTFRHRSSKEKYSSGPRSSETASSERPFAFAYLPLFTDSRAFLEDGSHSLVLYRADKLPHISTRDYYTAPAVMKVGLRPDTINIPVNLAKTAVPIRDTFTIRSFLCSTRFTSNSVLLGLLNWEKLQDKSELLTALSKFTFVGEVEIVKFLRDIFDSLFAILISSANQDGEMDDLVFNALVTVLGIVQDRRFNNFQPVLDVYIEKHFTCTSASYHIIHSMNRLLSDPTGTESASPLRAALKVWHYIFKIIIRARGLQKAKEVGLGATAEHLESNFKRELWFHLEQINRLMSTTSPSSIIGTQTIALQRFTSILPELAEVFNKDEVVSIVSEFVNASSTSTGRMVMWKLMMYLQLVKGFLFDSPQSRSALVESIASWIKPHFGAFDEFSSQPSEEIDAARDNARISWLESIRLCVSIVAVMLDKLQQCLISPAIVNDHKLYRQEQDNVESLLPLIPRLLDAYREQQSPGTQQALGRHRSAATTPSALPVVFPGTYPFPLLSAGVASRISLSTSAILSPVDRPSTFNCGLSDTSVVLLVLILSAPRKHLLNYLQEFADIEGKDHLNRLLLNFIHFAISVLNHQAFPSNWLNVNILAHKVILKMAEPIGLVLIQNFIPDTDASAHPEDFNIMLWHDALYMLLKLLSSDQLVIEEFSPQKRRAVWRLANDIRGEGATLLFEIWQAICSPQTGTLRFWSSNQVSENQVSFMALVEHILNLCLSHHDQLRTNAVRMLYSMIVSEYHRSGNFSGIEGELIIKLDKLLMADTRGDDITRAFFILQLRQLFDSPDVEEELKLHVADFLDSVDLFLDLLLSVRELPDGEEYQDDRVIATLRLMNFIRRIGKDDMYIRYVHQLVNMHLQSQNYVEAALTLKLHSDLHDWDLHTFVDPMPELDLPRQSQFVRKETLCLLILEYLGKGKAWESAIEICKELAFQHSEVTFNYQRLSEILVHQAGLLESIVTEQRYYSEYFRVVFYGNFPNAIRDKQFIYRGYEWEKLGAFCERMMNKHPGAHLIKSNLDPPEDVRNSSMQYIQCSAVTPEPDRTLSIFTNPDVPQAVRQYYEHSAINVFSSTRHFARRQSHLSGHTDFRDAWVEKTYFTTEESFPTVLRRSEVVEVHVVEISPIENALQDVETKTRELHLLEVKYSASLQTEMVVNTNQLAAMLNNVVDTPEDGGVGMYRQAFLGPDYLNLHPEDEESVRRLSLAIEDQVRVIARCLALHGVLCPPEMRHFHSVLDKFFQKNFQEEIERLNVDSSSTGISPLSTRYNNNNVPEYDGDSFSPISPLSPNVGGGRHDLFDPKFSFSIHSRERSVIDLPGKRTVAPQYQTPLQRSLARLSRHGMNGLATGFGSGSTHTVTLERAATLMSEPRSDSPLNHIHINTDVNGSVVNVTSPRDSATSRGSLSRRFGSIGWRSRGGDA